MVGTAHLRSDIQGLRAIAVIGVMLYHFNKFWLPGGFIGVDIFFVISGFLITQIILRQKEYGEFSIVRFYGSRLSRILPAYMVLLFVVSIIASIVLVPKDFDVFRNSAFAAFYFNSNKFFASQYDYFAPAAYEMPLLHTWSLAVEMKFYLLLPVAFIIMPVRSYLPAVLLICVALISWSEYLVISGERQSVYFSLFSRVPEFLVGSIAAFQLSKASLSRPVSNIFACLGLVLISLSFSFISESQGFPGVLALPACIGTAFLLMAQKSCLKRVLSWSPLVWVGGISYSLYLWHWPILASIRYITGVYELQIHYALFFLISTFACAYLSYRYIEIPFRGRSGTKAVFGSLVAISALAFTVFIIASFANPKLIAPMAISLTRYADGSKICHGAVVGNCVRGDQYAKRKLLMLGDSHGAQLNYFADVVGRSLHVAIKVITASSCVTIPNFDVNRLPEGARQDCLKQIVEGQKYYDGADAIIIAGMWQYQSPSDEFMKSLDQFIASAAKRQQQVIVLAQVPMLSSNPQRIYRLNNIGFHMSASMNGEWVAANYKVKELVSKHGNAYFLDLSSDPFFIDAPLQAGVLIYQDTHHLNEIGSQRYGHLALPHLKSLLDGMRNR